MPVKLEPIGANLPPRRVSAMTSSRSTHDDGDWSSAINVTTARDRMLEFFERDQMPGDVKGTLAAALNGDLHYQHLLFTAMIDSWPKLQSNINELAREAANAPWEIIPFKARGEEPTTKAQELAKEVEEIIWRMKPDVKRSENDFEGLVASLATAYFMGHGVSEIRWQKAREGTWKIKATKPIPARFYGYPYDNYNQREDEEDRLMFEPSGMSGGRNFIDFPDNRFLIAINSGHTGHPATAAPLRALTAYWLAAVYGLKWFMNFTQLYGIPWRHAKVADPNQRNIVARALDEIGSTGRIVTDLGVAIDVLSPGTGSGQSLPQRELIDLADRQCDQFILGQTLTSGTDGSGSRALGEVHQGTKEKRVDAITDFVGRILTYQLIPTVVRVNWGDRDDMPEIWAKREEVKDEAALASRDKTLKEAFPDLKWSKSYLYERHNLPIPDGDDVLDIPEKVNLTAGSRSVTAAQDEVDNPETVDLLADAVLEDLTGVTREWLTPIRPTFERLAALAMAKDVTDEDFLAALERAQREMPELFDKLNTQSLEDAFEKAIGTAMLAGSVKRYEQ